MEAWQAQLLAEERAGVLGTIARSGLPQLVPVCFALVEGDIAIAIDEKPKRGGTLARVRNIERDPRATLLVDHYEERWERLAWLRLEGDASVLERGAEVAGRARFAAPPLSALPRHGARRRCRSSGCVPHAHGRLALAGYGLKTGEIQDQIGRQRCVSD